MIVSAIALLGAALGINSPKERLNWGAICANPSDMKNCAIRVCWRLVLCFAATACAAKAQQQQTTVTITEPARVKIDALMKQADLVASVHILSGDSEHYPRAVYKAEVLEAFKGVKKGAIIYFGPFIGYALGEELVVFLKHSEQGIDPKPSATSSGVNYGPISSFYLIMYDGYSALQVKYECVFDGKDSAQQCDDGVRVNTYQVILPKNIKAYPSSATDSSSEDAKWVRKTAFFEYLQQLSN